MCITSTQTWRYEVFPFMHMHVRHTFGLQLGMPHDSDRWRLGHNVTPLIRYQHGADHYATHNTVRTNGSTALCPSTTVLNVLPNVDKFKKFEIRAHYSYSWIGMDWNDQEWSPEQTRRVNLCSFGSRFSTVRLGHYVTITYLKWNDAVRSCSTDFH